MQKLSGMIPLEITKASTMRFNIHRGEKLVGSERTAAATVAIGDLSLTG